MAGIPTTVELSTVVDSIGESLRRGEGAFFLGSGISVPSGLPNWFKLISDLSARLDVTITENDDLALMAQHCVNADSGERGPLISRLRRLLTNSPRRFNPYHQALKRTAVRTIWTTNFDTLLERAFDGQRVGVRANDADLTSGTTDVDVEILKIHGCIDRSPASDVVITREDYENFAFHRPAMVERLRHDLLNRSLLFAGYSYRDPNIQTVVVEARRLSRGAVREHYIVLKRETEPSLAIRQELWQRDVRRFGIRSALIDDYKDLESMFERLARAARGLTVFVTGSHNTATTTLADEVGRELAKQVGVVLLDGQSEGIGRWASNAFGRELIALKMDIRPRIRYFPNPYSFNPALANDPALLPVLRALRASLMRAAHTVIVFDGGMGTTTEVDLAREMGCKILPVPQSKKGLAFQLLEEPAIRADLDDAYVRAAASLKITAAKVVAATLRSFEQ